MQRVPNSSNPHDDHTRLILALLLVITYVLLVFTSLFIPSARDLLIILGPFVGAVVAHYFNNRTRRNGEHYSGEQKH